MAPDDLDEELAVLRGGEARHAATSLRLRIGERLRVADGQGRLADAVALEVSPTVVRARVVAMHTEPSVRPRLCVAVGLPKAGKLDLVVQKVTELGVEVVAPVKCRRSVTRWDPAKAVAASERLTAIALAAAKQCHRARVPEIRVAAELTDALPELPRPLVVCSEDAVTPLREVLPAQPPAQLTLLIGPEGGLEADEVAACEQAGGAVASLGPLVLRAETAAIAAPAIVAFHYGRLG